MISIGLFVDFCVFSCFYQFLHDVIIKVFCRSKQNENITLIFFFLTYYIQYSLYGLWSQVWIKQHYLIIKYTVLQCSCCLGSLAILYLWNAYVPEDGNERGREATPTSISVFDSYGIKTSRFEFGNDTFTGIKIPRL